MSETTININGIDLKIKSKIKNYGVKFPNTDSKDTMLHNQFTITLINKTQTKRTFNYYGSNRDYENGIDELNDSDMKFAARSIFDDATYSINSFDDFCSELGYSNDSIKASKMYNECNRTRLRLNALGFNSDDLYKALEDFSNQGIE